MKLTGYIGILILILVLSAASGNAQEAVLSSGNTISGANGSASYSIGQVAYSNYSSTSGSISEGVQQVYDITTILEKSISGMELSVFPNPVNDKIFVELKSRDNNQIHLSLKSIQGKTLISDHMTQGKKELDLSKLPAATYFLEAGMENENFKTIKIIKN